MTVLREGLSEVPLPLRQPERKIADRAAIATCAIAPTTRGQHTENVMACSSKRAGTNCQNRYPSPSERSGHSRVRPLHSFACADGRNAADGNQLGQFAFAFHMPDVIASGQNEAEGQEQCVNQFGSSVSWHSPVWPPVVTRRLNKASWAPAPARLRVPSRAATSLRAPQSARRATCFTASSIRRAATDLPRACGRNRHRKVIGLSGPVAFFCLSRGKAPGNWD